MKTKVQATRLWTGWSDSDARDAFSEFRGAALEYGQGTGSAVACADTAVRYVHSMDNGQIRYIVADMDLDSPHQFRANLARLFVVHDRMRSELGHLVLGRIGGEWVPKYGPTVTKLTQNEELGE